MLLFTPALLLAGERYERYALILSDPPLAEEFHSAADLQSPAALARRRKIEDAQQTLKSALAAAQIPVTSSTLVVLNAVYVRARPSQLSLLEKMPGVARVRRLGSKRPQDGPR